MTTKLSIRVVNMKGFPMDDCLVDPYSWNAGGKKTDNGGVATFEDVPPGMHKVYLAHKHCRSTYRIVDVVDAPTQTVQIVMYPNTMEFAGTV